MVTRKVAIDLLEAYAVAQWFYQLYSLCYQDVHENLSWYLHAFQDVFFRGGLLCKIVI